MHQYNSLEGYGKAQSALSVKMRENSPQNIGGYTDIVHSVCVRTRGADGCVDGELLKAARHDRPADVVT